MPSNSTNQTSSQSYEAYINTLNNQFVYYFVLSSSAIGIPGNLISMLVFIRIMFKNPKINMGFLYTCQTAIDATVLIFTLLVFRGSTYLFGYLVLNYNLTYCRTFAFLRRFVLQASSWMVVIISFDRFTFVLYESRFKFMRSKLNLSAIILGVMFLLAIADLENFFYYIDSATFKCTSSNTISVAADMVAVFFRTYIPLVLMLVFNILMINRIFKRKRSSMIIHNNAIKRKEHHFTIAVISCDVLFFLSKFPLSVFYILYDIDLYSGVFKKDSTLSVVYSFYLNIFVSISSFDQIFSIFMYFSFNKVFHKEFCRMFLSCLPCKALVNDSSAVKSVSKRNNSSLT